MRKDGACANIPGFTHHGIRAKLKKMNFSLSTPSSLLYKGDYEIQGLQVLKLICAFFVVNIHLAWDWKYVLLPVSRIAVPVFFMISGYFMLNKEGVLQGKKVKKMLFKILWMTFAANLVYMVADIWLDPWRSRALGELYTWIRLVLIGDHFSCAFWYLNAYIQALAIIFLFIKLKAERWLYLWIPVGLFFNFILGKYCIFDYPLSNATHRNVFTIALPCIMIGVLIRRNQEKFQKFGKWIWLPVLLVPLAVEWFLCRRLGFTSGDIYIFTIPLAVSVFMLFLNLKERKWLQPVSRTGSVTSTDIFLFHMLMSTILARFAENTYLYDHLWVLAVFLATMTVSLLLHATIRGVSKGKF
ncbi:MAG: acyltransferase [Bacteroides sp.]|nr:acyltransferase [Bacteroides sp.]MCM1085705.1 acyltransferase [Bacteroides sp.]